MNKIFLVAFCIFAQIATSQQMQSPSGKIVANFTLDASGAPFYNVLYKGKMQVANSKLGLILKNTSALDSGFTIENFGKQKIDETWTPVLGEESSIRNHCNEYTVSLSQASSRRKLNIVFRVFDEGIAFKYEFPKQPNLNYFIISDESTQIRMTGDHKIFWLPGDFNSQEYVYNETLISDINTEKIDMDNGITLKSIAGKYVVQSPLQIKTKDGVYINIFEAAVVNYPVMHLDTDVKNYTFTARLVPNTIGDKAYLQAPCSSPWRTIMITDDARDIVGSKMILNLNEPSKLKDVSWIKPMKYVGIWWEMHVGISTWDYSGMMDASQTSGTKKPHGATTENTKKYIDFAAKNGFEGVLVEGWNAGWEDWYGNWKEEVFDFVTPYPDFNLAEVSAYAKSKNVKMIMHNETSGSVSNYERHLDRALKLMNDYNYPSVKTGYVGKIIPRGEFHDGQTMVNHYNYVAKRAADFKIMVNSHESSRPTGVSRTYPNYIAAEAARGNEFNAWSSGNPPSHETILPFTRLLGGPMDYTPGIFETKMNIYDKNNIHQVQTTLTKQLALYVTMYSPIQMAADLPENYERYPDAFQFIKDVAVDWDKSIYLEAEPGDYLTVARKAKGSENWFIGAITDENSRDTSIKLDFLNPNQKYKATIYADGADADWKNNPQSYKISTRVVKSTDVLKLKLAQGGGAAISIFPMK